MNFFGVRYKRDFHVVLYTQVVVPVTTRLALGTGGLDNLDPDIISVVCFRASTERSDKINVNYPILGRALTLVMNLNNSKQAVIILALYKQLNEVTRVYVGKTMRRAIVV